MKGKIKVEKAPTGRSTCKGCGNYIAMNSYRVVQTYQGRFQVKDKYCTLCGTNLINDTIEELNGFLSKLGGKNG